MPVSCGDSLAHSPAPQELNIINSIYRPQTKQGVAGLGVTVITVLHQPRYEIFAMFDR